MCGWSTADVGGLPSGLLIALLVGAVVLGRPRR
jgi:MYXO-CTERM domain-containing protein